MITELRAQNFKSRKDTETLRFAPLPAPFGATGAKRTSNGHATGGSAIFARFESASKIS